MTARVEVHPSFGAVLRHFRMEAKMSLAQLTAEVHFSRGHLSKVENGFRAPSVHLARKCDEVLRAKGVLNALVREVNMGGDPAVVSRLVPRQFSMNDRPDSRPPGIAPMLELTLAGGVDPLDGWLEALGAIRQLGQSAGPAMVVPMAVAAADSVFKLAAGLRSPARERAYELASRCCVYAGWMMQEAGDIRQAVRWTEHAVELAELAGDSDLAAYAMVRKGLMALYDRDWEQTIELAARAQRLSHDPRILALAALREAQGHAAAGVDTECLLAIDRANSQFALASTGVGSPLLVGTSTVSDPVAMTTGWCLYDLGKPRRAVEVLTNELAKVPVAAQRSRSRWSTRLALSLVSLREIDEACRVLEPVLQSAALIDSATIRKDLRQVSAKLGRWDREPQVRRLMPMLTAVSTGQI